MPVRVDIINGSGLQVTKTKRKKTLIANVTGLTPGTSYVMEEAARTASGVPQLGAALGPMNVVGHDVELLSNNSAKVAIHYETGDGASQADPENPNLPQYEVGSQLQQENISFLPDGTPVTVTYKGETRGASMTVDVSLYFLRVSRVETGILPGLVAKKLLNRVNSKAWQGGEPGTWKCTNVIGRSLDGVSTWDMNYDFAFSEAGHQPVVIAIDPSTGGIYSDASLDTEDGAKRVTYYPSFDFSLLGI